MGKRDICENCSSWKREFWEVGFCEKNKFKTRWNETCFGFSIERERKQK